MFGDVEVWLFKVNIHSLYLTKRSKSDQIEIYGNLYSEELLWNRFMIFETHK